MSMFMEQGIRTVRMEDIAREAGISKKTLYQLVPSKSALIAQIVQQRVQDEQRLIEALRKDQVDALEEMLAIARHITEMFRRVNPVMLDELRRYYPESWMAVNTLHRQHILDIIHGNLKDGQSQGFYRQDMDPAIIARLYVTKAMALIDTNLFPRASYVGSRLIDNHLKYHFHGILSPEGHTRLKNLNL
jgi:AcrR family transcriptional regulator